MKKVLHRQGFFCIMITCLIGKCDTAEREGGDETVEEKGGKYVN